MKQKQKINENFLNILSSLSLEEAIAIKLELSIRNINNKLYNIGTLGKPHALNGYLYINHEIFFRIFSFKNKKVYINNREYEIKEIKKHLKNRFLVKILKIDNIDSAEKLRNYDVSISIEEIYFL